MYADRHAAQCIDDANASEGDMILWDGELERNPSGRNGLTRDGLCNVMGYAALHPSYDVIRKCWVCGMAG
jgi:hypothetical protein